MKKSISHNLQITRFVWMLLLLVGLCSAASAATFTVTKIADTNDGVCDSDCSLREAINASNSATTDDIIQFDTTVFSAAQIIILSGTELTILNNGKLAINGTGANLLTVNGNNASRVFSVNLGSIATISNLRITGGNGVGAINSGTGGGIHINGGTLSLENVSLSNNETLSGGAILSSSGSTIIINNSMITNNIARNGGGIYSSSATTSVSNSIIDGNTATGTTGFALGGGGGIFINNGTFSLISSTVSNNKTLGASSFGGGIVAGGSTTIESSIIKNNKSIELGAGIYSISKLDVINTEISGNSFGSNLQTAGGGIVHIGNDQHTITFNLTKSTVSNNAARDGGGIILSNSVCNITDSTISSNKSTNRGGGVNISNSVVSFVSSTISSNTASVSGGGVNGSNKSRNSIFADNTAPSAPDVSGFFESEGYNLIENTNGSNITGISTGNILGQDPQLLPLGNYGGATQTHALRATSPAIDKGNSLSVTTDQRGKTRPYDNPNIPNATGGDGSDIGSFERQANDTSGSTLFDFDGDSKADISVFRPSNGLWYLLNSGSGFGYLQFGASTDKLVPADYDGDGKTDIAVFRGDTWFIQRSTLGFTNAAFGQAGDIPVPADYDADGKADIAVYRPSTGTWFLQRSTLGFTGIQFGIDGDVPMPGDFDGDGKADLALFRPSNGIWYILGSTQGFYGVQFGAVGDKLVPADYDGDGKTDIAVFRPSNATFYINRSQLGLTVIQFGISTDVPVPADYDGDGKADIAVYRNDTWFIQRSTSDFTGVQFGGANDQPIPNAYIR